MVIDKKKFAWLLNTWSFALLVGLITLLVYLPALDNGFVTWDDDVYLYNNDHIRHLNGEFFRWAFTGYLASNWHPLTWISHALDYAIWGLNPFGHHLTNILLHSLNTLLVTHLTYQLLRSFSTTGKGTFLNQINLPIIALITGLLFGLHPLHVETVAWIAERKDLLCAFFYLLSLLFYLRICHSSHNLDSAGKIYRNTDYLACFALFSLALMSKPMAVSLPCVLILIDWLHGDGRNRRDWRLMLTAKIPFVVLALASAMVTISAQKSGGAISTLTAAPFIDRLWVASHALVAYLQKMVWPVDLQPFYIYPKSVQWLSLQYLGSALLVVVISITALWNISRYRNWAVAWGYYVITLIPVLGIVKVGGQAMADRYTYLPSIAPFILLSIALVWTVQRLSWRKLPLAVTYVPLGIVIISLVIAMSLLTQKQIRIWESGETLWKYQIQHDDQIPLAYRQLGIALFERAEYAEAAQIMSKALRLTPLDGELLSNMAICHLELGDLDKAMQMVRNALNINGKNLFALNTLGEIHLAKQQYAEANNAFFKAMQMEPEKPLRLFNLAVSFDKLEDTQQACIYWRRYMAVDVTEKHDVEIIAHLVEIGCPVDTP